MNWYKYIIKLSQTSPRGEYWITNGGDVLGADGDVGTMGHEEYVIDEIRRKYADETFCNDEYFDYTAWNRFEEYLYKQELQKNPMLFQQNQIENVYKDKRNEFINKALKELGMSDEEIRIARGNGNDARRYAMENWGWKRVENENIETWTLTSEDMRDIVRGVNDIMGWDEEEKEPTVNIYIHTNNKWYTDIPLSSLEAGNPMSVATFQSFASKKIAAPVMEIPENYSYTSIGHADEKNIILWIIDKDYNFYEREIGERGIGNDIITDHYSWIRNDPLIKTWNNILVQGRYDPDSHKTSAAINDDLGLNDFQKRYLKNKTDEILDYKLESPVIYWSD